MTISTRLSGLKHMGGGVAAAVCLDVAAGHSRAPLSARFWISAFVGLLLLASGSSSSRAGAVLDIGARRELLVDRYLIDRLDHVRLKLHEPRDEGEVLRYDQPWEGPFCAYNTVIQDGALFRLYYRGKVVSARDGVVYR